MQSHDRQIKFTLDVNTKHTGWSLYVNGKLTGYGVIHTDADTRTNLGAAMNQDHYQIVKALTPLFVNLRNSIEEDDEKSKISKNTYIMIGIENSKMKTGASTQQKLDLYSGMYLAYVSHTCRVMLPKARVAIKLITAAWQDKIFKKDAGESKNNARKFASTLLPEGHAELTIANDPGGDMADAICIGYILEDLQDHGTTAWFKGQKSKNIARVKNKLQNAKEKLAEYNLRSSERIKKGLTATDSQLAIRIQTKKEEIEKYESELKEWQSK